MHPPLGEPLHLSAMRDAMLLCPQNVHGDSCAGNLSVLICKTESAQSHSHSSGTGTYENLFCAHRGTLPACSFRSLLDLFDFETLCLSKSCYSKDFEGHLMSFWLQSARALCFSLFLHLTWKEWHGMIFTAIPPVFLRESWELPPHVSKESPLSKHCRIASDCSLRFQLKTKRWSWRLWEMKLTCIRLLKLLTFLNHPNSIKHWWHCMHLFAWFGFCQQQIATWRLKTLGLCTASPLCWAMIWGALSDLGWNAEVGFAYLSS